MELISLCFYSILCQSQGSEETEKYVACLIVA